MVTVRQRPQTANGTLFLLLEDEFGFINIIVPSTLVEDNAEVVKFAPFIVVQGKFERDGWKLAGDLVPIAYVVWSLWLLATGIALLA